MIAHSSSTLANQHIDSRLQLHAQQQQQDGGKILIETIDALAQLKCNQFLSQNLVNNASTLSSSTSSTSSTGYSSSASALTAANNGSSPSSFMSTPGATSAVIFSQTNHHHHHHLLMPMPHHFNSSGDTASCANTNPSSPSMTSVAHASCLMPVTSPTALIAINNSVPCTTSIIGQKRNKRRSNNKKSKSQNSSLAKSLSNVDCSENSMAYFNGIEPCGSSASSNGSNNAGSMSTSPSVNKISLPYSCKITIPKAPKPQRTLIVLESVILGLNSNINEVKSKVADLTLAVTNGYTALAKQLLQTEAYLRHLEQRISTLHKLQNSYQIHINMKDGIQNMYEAFKKSPGNQYKNLTNIKNGWKECIQTLCAIEAQTEALLGTFQFQVEKLIGFARLCPGDTYELQIKYGPNAKFRARTKIAKDGSQLWDSTRFSFKVTVHDLLSIKINEIKFLGKNLLVGERACDTKDLFATTHTQRLTFNANTSGTLKLSMLITWLPFENCEESFIYFNPTQYLTVNSKEKRLSSYNMSKLASGLSNSCMTSLLHAGSREDSLTSGNSPSLSMAHHRSDSKLPRAGQDLHIDIDNEESTSSKHSLNTNPAEPKNDQDNDDNESSSSSSSSVIVSNSEVLASSHGNDQFGKKLFKDCLQESNDLPNQSTTYSTDSLSSSGSSCAKSSSASVSPAPAKSSNEENRFAHLKPDNDVIIEPSAKRTPKSLKKYQAPQVKSPEKDIEKVLCDLLDNLVANVSNRLQNELAITLSPKKPSSPLAKSSAFAIKPQSFSPPVNRNSIVNKRISMLWLDQNIRNSLFLENDDDVNQNAVNSLVELKNELDLGFIGLYSEDSLDDEELIESNSLRELIDLILDVRLKSSTIDLTKFHRDVQSPCLRKVIAHVETRLEDLRSQYIELNDFYELMQRLGRIFYRISRLNERLRSEGDYDNIKSDEEPVLALVVEDVLHCFDFLNSEPDNKSPDPIKVPRSGTFGDGVDSSETDQSEMYPRQLWLLPFDLESVITQHLGSCLIILNCLFKVNAAQNSSKLVQIEAMLFEKLNREKTALRRLMDLICLDLSNLNLWNKLKSTRESNFCSETHRIQKVDQILDRVFRDEQQSHLKRTIWLDSADVSTGSRAGIQNYLCADRSRVLGQIKTQMGVKESKMADQLLARLLDRVGNYTQTTRINSDFPVEMVSVFHFNHLMSLLCDEENTQALESLLEELSKTSWLDRNSGMTTALKNGLTNAAFIDLVLHSQPAQSEGKFILDQVQALAKSENLEAIIELTVEQLMIKHSARHENDNQTSSSLSFLHSCLENLMVQKFIDGKEYHAFIEFVQVNL